MKEVTFEELIESFKKYENFWLLEPQQKELNEAFENQLKEFGKQVREATIAECSQIIEDIVGNTFDEIEEMKTDRIKIEE